MRQQRQQRQQGPQKRELEPFDKLQFVKKEQTYSEWAGEKGVYVFKAVESKAGKRAPIRQVYLNREYMTGLFKTKSDNTFSGDLKDSFDNSKKYLLFKVLSAEQIEILQKK